MKNVEKLENWKYKNESRTIPVIHLLNKLGGKKFFNRDGDFAPQQEYIIAQIPTRISPDNSARINSTNEYKHKISCVSCVQKLSFIPDLSLISNWVEYIVLTPELLKEEDIFNSAIRYDKKRAVENGLLVGFLIALISLAISAFFSLFEYVSLGFLENYFILFFIYWSIFLGILFLINKSKYVKNTKLMRDEKDEEKMYLYRRSYLKNCDLKSCTNIKVLSSAKIECKSDTILAMHKFIEKDEKGEEKMAESLYFEARKELDNSSNGMFAKIYY